MKEKKYGFTLIELLAVIIILGVLMVIAIPSVTSYIQSSRKNAYATTAKELIKGVSHEVNSGELEYYDPDVTYYYPGSCVTTESGGNSSFGDWRDYYVVYTYNGNGFDYYWASVDSANMGVYLTYSELIDGESVIPDVKEINPNIGVGSRSKVSVIDNGDCKSIASTIEAAETIEEHGKYGGESDIPTNVNTTSSCFEFDESTGTITGYLCSVEHYDLSITDLDKCANYFMSYEYLDFNNANEANNFCKTDFMNYLNDGWFWDDEIEDMINNGFLKKGNVIPPQFDVVIPSKINGVQVKEIGDYAFSWIGLNSVSIPEGVTKIGVGAFTGNYLKSINLPNSLKYIDYDAFVNNYLSKVVIPSNVETINDSAFENAGMLYEIVNKTGRSFEWYKIIGKGNVYDYTDHLDDNPFVSGQVNHTYKNYEYRGINTTIVTNITTGDSINIPIDNMFEFSNHESIILKNKGDYEIYYYTYYGVLVEANVGDTLGTGSGTNCFCDHYVLIKDKTGKIVFANFVNLRNYSNMCVI